jgi:hypothetical protein
MANEQVRTRQGRPRRSQLARRVALALALATPIGIVALWVAVNRITWLGPVVADGLRAVIGKEAVTELENIAYGVQDRLYRYTRKDEQPKAYWEVPEITNAPTEPVADTPDAQATQPERSAFVPNTVGPVHDTWSAPGDGQWIPIAIPDLPALRPHLYKTLLHPDKQRSWAELFVVAMSVHEIDLHLVAGSREPEATVEQAKDLPRPGNIPERDHAIVLGAFNGGFKTEHGKYGMGLGDVILVGPRDGVCGVAGFKDDRIVVASWDNLKGQEAQMRWWRQTPNCMYENGKLHDKLVAGYTKKWGATLDGETVIRRSAIGIDSTGDTLFVGISNHTTANAIALGMNHAGASAVAQLDVNFSYPKFVLFERPAPDAPRKATALAQGFEFSDDEFIRKPSHRDFFYVTPRSLRPEQAGD